VTIEFEGAIIVAEDESVDSDRAGVPTPSDRLRPGEMYVARRNTGWKLLTCLRVDAESKCVVPVEVAYCFDTWECHRVLEIR
jgi:hypothetical protein